MALVARLRGEAPGDPAPGGWRELDTEELRGTRPVSSRADAVEGTAT